MAKNKDLDKLENDIKVSVEMNKEDESRRKALELVSNCITQTETDTQNRKNDYISNKHFFLAKESEMYDSPQASDETRRPFPISSMITLYYRDLIAGISPDVRVIPPDLSREAETEEEKSQLEEGAQIVADSAEKVVDLTFDLNGVPLQFYDNALSCGVLGDAFVRVFWDKSDKRGGTNGTPIIDFIPPERVRIKWASNNFREIEAFVTSKRVSVSMIKELYGIDVQGDTQDKETAGGDLHGWTSNPAGAKDFPMAREASFEDEKTDIPMQTVYNYWDKERYIITVGLDNVVRDEKHNHGFVPIFHIPNLRVPGEPWGYPDHYFIMDAQKSYNFLVNKAESIINYQAGPIILDVGNTLKGRRLPSGNSVVVPIPLGNEMRYLQWNGNLFPVLQTMDEVRRVMLEIQGLPPSLTATSGFMVQVQMVKALLRNKGKKEKVWGACFEWIAKRTLQLVKKFDKTDLPEGVENLQIEIKWPEVLPQDEARIFANIATAKQLGVMSDYTAIERYGNESPFEEIRKIEDEQRRKTELGIELKAIQQQAQPQAVEPLPTGGELVQNQPQVLPEEKRPVAEGEEQIAPTSMLGA